MMLGRSSPLLSSPPVLETVVTPTQGLAAVGVAAALADRLDVMRLHAIRGTADGAVPVRLPECRPAAEVPGGATAHIDSFNAMKSLGRD